eukprot:TRINITY_DN38834_c0_g1_i1.p1 TRINITY_DN38834_c0_g1~~TRINITY_DN38834_c0_g1_i1.p1  ORF type:complete len:746 (+),score=97.03 TRINITY_DN38834_c0_g1_i1:154-2391(+)
MGALSRNMIVGGGSGSDTASTQGIGRRGTIVSAPGMDLARKREDFREDKKVGEAFNELFRDRANVRDPQLMENFWTEVKDRLVRRHGTMGGVFEEMRSACGDGGINFSGFSDLLKGLQMPLDPRSCRNVFEKASGPNERVLSLDQFRHLLMDRTIRKLRFVMQGFNQRHERIQRNVGLFLRRIALDDPSICSQSACRFQQKLTADFCRQFWKLMLAQLGKSPSPHLPVERIAFRQIVQKAVGDGLQSYDVVFMMRLYHRIDSLNGNVSVCDIVVVMLLLSPEIDRCRKTAQLFEVYDSDYDGCLLWDQLLSMFKCLCKLRPVVEESSLASSDFNFQDELAAQEGIRSFECTRWHLQRGTNLEGDIVSLRELWVALAKQDDLLHTLMPGSIHMDSWALTPVPGETEEQTPVDPGSGGLSNGHSASLRRQRRSTTPEKLFEDVSDVSKMSRFSTTGGSAFSRSQARSLTGNTSEARHGAGVDHNASGCSINFRNVSGEDWRDFRNARTTRFQQSLQNYGVMRLAELSKGFLPPSDPGQMEDHEIMVASPHNDHAGTGRFSPASTHGSTGGIANCSPSTPQTPGTPGTIASVSGRTPKNMGDSSRSGMGASGRSGLSRTASAPAGQLTQTPKSGMGYASPASTGRGSRTAGGVGGAHATPNSPASIHGTSAGASASMEERFPGYRVTPSRHSIHWGQEAVDRFRVVAAGSKSAVNNSAKVPALPDKGVGFQCQICQRPHTFKLDSPII